MPNDAKRVVVITGGSRGIGAATARLAARRGFSVCLTYRSRREAACDVVSDILREGAKGLAVRVNVSIEGDGTG